MNDALLRKMLVLLVLLAILPYTSGALGGLIGRTQSAGVEGTLTCNGMPLGDVLVKLYDDDRGQCNLFVNYWSLCRQSCERDLLIK